MCELCEFFRKSFNNNVPKLTALRTGYPQNQSISQVFTHLNIMNRVTHSTTHSISQLIHTISQGNSQALSVFYSFPPTRPEDDEDTTLAWCSVVVAGVFRMTVTHYGFLPAHVVPLAGTPASLVVAPPLPLRGFGLLSIRPPPPPRSWLLRRPLLAVPAFAARHPDLPSVRAAGNTRGISTAVLV